jgi:hypothetical protein
MFSETCNEISIQLQRGANSRTLKSMKINLGMSTSLGLRPSEAHHTLNGRNIIFMDDVKYLGVIFDKKIT